MAEDRSDFTSRGLVYFLALPSRQQRQSLIGLPYIFFILCRSSFFLLSLLALSPLTFSTSLPPFFSPSILGRQTPLFTNPLPHTRLRTPALPRTSNTAYSNSITLSKLPTFPLTLPESIVDKHRLNSSTCMPQWCTPSWARSASLLLQLQLLLCPSKPSISILHFHCC
jgi:hypothetical protein